MHVQELDELASWFKKNVLEIQSLDDDVVDMGGYEEFSRAETVEQVNEQDDELRLIEYIIGVNGMDP